MPVSLDVWECYPQSEFNLLTAQAGQSHSTAP
jgi:hypothetical protein